MAWLVHKCRSWFKTYNVSRLVKEEKKAGNGSERPRSSRLLSKGYHNIHKTRVHFVVR